MKKILRVIGLTFFLPLMFINCKAEEEADNIVNNTDGLQIVSKDKGFIDDNYSVPADFSQIKDGVTYGEVKYINYFSTTANSERKAVVILPPGYTETKKYPVLYLMHGIGGKETDWLDGKAREIIGNMIAEGTSKEVIAVLQNIYVRRSDEPMPEWLSLEQFVMHDRAIDDLKNDLRPYIEKNYSVLTGRDNQAVAGLSMGGREAINVGVRMIDDFAYTGAFCPAIGVLPYSKEKGLFTASTLTIPEEYRAKTLIMIIAGENDTVVGTSPYDYSNALKNNGVNHIFKVVPGGHWFDVWSPALYNFLRRSFQ